MKQRIQFYLQQILDAVQRHSPITRVFIVFAILLSGSLLVTRANLHQKGLTTAVLPTQGEQSSATLQPSPEQRFAARVGITHEAIDLSTGTIDVRKITPMPLQKLSGVDNETLWLARCVYSETNRPEEMELVAWAIRNRVETSYRGKDTYKEVVLDPWQFSAFNNNSPKRGYFIGLTTQTRADKWQDALTVAHIVKNAPSTLRPFSKATRHYYSERSMVGRRQPAWAAGAQPITPNRPFDLEARRFRFFEDIS